LVLTHHPDSLLAKVLNLVQGRDGNFYGTTAAGGANNSTYCKSLYEYEGNDDLRGCGTVFKMTPEGKLTTTYSFCAESGCRDGYAPGGGLVQGNDGGFYGTTILGGEHDNCTSILEDTQTNGCGTVFRITAAGQFDHGLQL
jgi:hypothetical protein